MRYDLGRCFLPEILKGIGVSNQDFAEKLGMSRQQASKIIRGETKMQTALLLSVCDTFEIDPMSVYELKPKPIKKKKL